MLPGDLLVCALVEPHAVGVRFKDWPLHVTIVPWFRLKTGPKTLAKDLQAALAEAKAFEAQMADSEPFGYNGHKLASLVRDPRPFVKIEKLVRTTLKRQGAWLVDETTKQRHEYRPHVTYQKSGHLNLGDSFYCDALYVVEQKGGHKEIAGKVELNHE